MKKIFRSTLAIAVAISLSACGGSSTNTPTVTPPPPPPAPTPTTLVIGGQAVKGKLANALVEVFSATDTAFATVLATTQTDANGDYSVTVTDDAGNPISGGFVVRITADSDTTMNCDASVCGDVANGESIPAAQLVGLSLSTITYSDGSGTGISAAVNTFTTMATDAVLSSASINGVDLSTVSASDMSVLQNTASAVVGQVLGIDLSTTNLFDAAIVDATETGNIPTNDATLATLTLMNASFSGLTVDTANGETLGSTIATITNAVESVSTAVINVLGTTNVVDTSGLGTELAVLADTQTQVADQVTTIEGELAAGGTVIETVVVEPVVDLTIIEGGDVVVGTGGTGGTGG